MYLEYMQTKYVFIKPELNELKLYTKLNNVLV